MSERQRERERSSRRVDGMRERSSRRVDGMKKRERKSKIGGSRDSVGGYESRTTIRSRKQLG